nr:MAG TPA: tail protein [Caudoviricetes sp.]
MSIKKLTKRIWYGSDTTVDSEGKTVAAAPPIATNDGSEDWDLNGLVRGELYLNDNKDDPALFCLGSDNLPKRIGGGTASGGGGIVNVDVDVKEGRGIDVKKDLIGETVIFTVSHENTSSAVSTSNFDDLFVQNIGVDDFGHVTSVESARLATYLDERYLRKDIDDTAHGNILFDKKIGSSIFIDGWEGKGWEIQSTGAAILDSLRVRSDIYVGGNTGSPTFASGFTGWGWQIDTPTATGEMDNLFIRKTFTAYEIVYSQIYGLGGSQIVSDINKIARVEVMSDRYRCYMDDMDGLMLMNLRKGDGVRIQTRTGTTSIKYLFGRCIGVDSDYFDIAIPLIEGTGQPEAGDFALRWGNNEDTDRQGLIYLTTADSGAPFIDVYDGITDASTEGKLKARIGHLTGIRTQRGDQLSGYGAYLNGIYVENSTFILQNGDTIEQTFIAMNGKFESLIDSIRNNISAEGGNILVNSSFSQNTNYWRAANNVHFINVGGEYLWLDGSFYVEKDQVADIYNDNGQNVLRIRNTYILQQNAIMNIPDHTEEEEKTYSFSLFYKVLRPGSCGFGIPGTELYHEEQLSESDSYQKLSKVGKWNGKGDFELRFTGEILIYGVGLFSDEIADAIVKLQTQIDQTDEYIKLLATKDYVDNETGEIYVHFDSQLQITAEQMSGISTKVDNINNTIESAGWITQADGVTLFAKKEMESGKAIVNAINVGTGGILIQANRINLVGAVSFTMLSDYTDVNSRINGKVDESDLGTLAYASSISKNNFASSLLQEFNGKANSSSLKALAYLDKVEQAQLGSTIISGGHIITSLIDTNSIYTNQAYIGNFTIENGWFKCNANPEKDVGYIDMRGVNTRIAFGRNLAPLSTGGSFTCTAIITNHNKARLGGTTYGLSVSASGDASTDVKPIAVDCDGGLRVKGNFGIIEDVFTGPNIAPSDSSFSSAKNLRNQRTYIYQPTSDITVNLPSDSAIESEFGYFNSGHAVVENSAIIIILLVTKWATGRIYVAAKGGTNNNIINENGDTINEASGSNTGFWMGKGDSAILMYFNKNWYMINRNS